MSIAVLYENAPALFKEERLSALNPRAYETLEHYITDILLNGSTIQRNGLLDNLDTLSDISMPEIRLIGRRAGTELISKYILESCRVLGCEFKGDLPAVASTLYDDYGGITLIEWARFFQMVCAGKYKTEYQSVNTRGLNMEFLREWLDRFYQRRDGIISSLRKEMPGEPVAEPENAPTLEQIRQFQRDSVALDGEVHTWRTEYDNSLTERKMEHCREERKTDDGKKVIYEYDIPTVTDKPKAAYTRLFDFLATFYAFKGENVKDIIEGLVASWELERHVIDEGAEMVDAPTFYRARAKMTYFRLRKFLIDEHRRILMAGLQNIAEKHPATGDFIKALTGKDYTGEKPGTSIAGHLDEVATKLVREFHNYYGDDARGALAGNKFVLYRAEYIALRCLHHAVTVGGIEHPFNNILNIEQQ